MRSAVLDGKPVDVLKDYSAALHVVGKQVLKHLCRGVGDDGTDAVAAADADGYLIELRVIDGIPRRIYSFNSLKL